MTRNSQDPIIPVAFALPKSVAARLRKLARELTGGNLSKLGRQVFADFLKAFDGDE